MFKTNSKAPLFKLNSTDGEIYSLKNSFGKYVILYFYPKDDTPGCTIETNDFNKLLPKFKKLNCDVLGISKDDLKSHHKFKEKYKIKFDLLSDVELNILKKYKVWAKKKFMGREYDGIHRMTFIVNEEGIVERVIDKVKTKEHAAQILN